MCATRLLLEVCVLLGEVRVFDVFLLPVQSAEYNSVRPFAFVWGSCQYLISHSVFLVVIVPQSYVICHSVSCMYLLPSFR